MLVVGSSGEVGQLMSPHWRRSMAPLVLQYRRGPAPAPGLRSLRWNPDNGSSDLVDWIRVQSHPPQAMLVMAGVTPRSGRDLQLNTQIAENCLSAAKEVGIRRVLIASSSAVYGDHLSRPFSEIDTPVPVNAYGVAKLAMEKACARWSPEIEVVCLRIGNVAGADAVLRQCFKPEPSEMFLDQFADGRTPERSYIGPGTLSEVLVELASLKEELPSVLNVAAPNPVQMGMLANAARLPWRERARSDTKGQSITLDCTRLCELLPTVAHVSDPAEIVAQLNLEVSIR